MPKRLLAILALAAAAAAYADPIRIVYGPITEQPANNGEAVAGWAQSAIDVFNANAVANDWDGHEQAPLPDLGTLAFKVDPHGSTGAVPSGWPTIVSPQNKGSLQFLLGGYNYLVLSWGGSNIPGERGTADYLYYIGSTSGLTEIAYPADYVRGGLSSISIYGKQSSVPDGGTTVCLVDLGLVGLAAFRRPFRA